MDFPHSTIFFHPIQNKHCFLTNSKNNKRFSHFTNGTRPANLKACYQNHLIIASNSILVCLTCECVHTTKINSIVAILRYDLCTSPFIRLQLFLFVIICVQCMFEAYFCRPNNNRQIEHA